MLLSRPLIAPAYYIIGGTKSNEGMIIARSREGVVVTTPMPTDDFFILETNYDQNKPTLYIDDRRTPGRACMHKLGEKGVSFEGA